MEAVLNSVVQGRAPDFPTKQIEFVFVGGVAASSTVEQTPSVRI